MRASDEDVFDLSSGEWRRQMSGLSGSLLARLGTAIDEGRLSEAELARLINDPSLVSPIRRNVRELWRTPYQLMRGWSADLAQYISEQQLGRSNQSQITIKLDGRQEAVFSTNGVPCRSVCFSPSGKRFAYVLGQWVMGRPVEMNRVYLQGMPVLDGVFFHYLDRVWECCFVDEKTLAVVHEISPLSGGSFQQMKLTLLHIEEIKQGRPYLVKNQFTTIDLPREVRHMSVRGGRLFVRLKGSSIYPSAAGCDEYDDLFLVQTGGGKPSLQFVDVMNATVHPH
ncbi:MAG: hypothetical protein Q8P82_01450, partial [bacterium]|nr:hypothetical protein [bacterium]